MTGPVNARQPLTHTALQPAPLHGEVRGSVHGGSGDCSYGSSRCGRVGWWKIRDTDVHSCSTRATDRARQGSGTPRRPGRLCRHPAPPPHHDPECPTRVRDEEAVASNPATQQSEIPGQCRYAGHITPVPVVCAGCIHCRDELVRPEGLRRRARHTSKAFRYGSRARR
jgi:hypothetical protein